MIAFRPLAPYWWTLKPIKLLPIGMAGQRQAVGDAVDVVWRTLLRYRESQKVAANADESLPDGWEQVVGCTKHLIAKFRGEIAEFANSQPENPSLLKNRCIDAIKKPGVLKSRA